jgi:hypothetical protein
MKGVKLPQLGQKVEIRLVGTVKSVEQQQADGVSGTLAELEFDVTEAKLLQRSDFSQLVED